MTDKMRCGSCLHFKQHAHPSHGDLCSKLGVKHYGVAPRCFTPDVSQLVENNEDLAALAVTFGSMTRKEQSIVVAILQTSAKHRPFTIGQKVYTRIVGGDYISNYMIGYVLGYTSTKQVIVAGSPEAKTRGRMYMAYLDPDTLLTPTAWAKHKANLARKGHFSDPKEPLVVKRKIEIDYEPPTLDRAPKEWKEAQVRRQRRKPEQASGGTKVIKVMGD